MLRREIPALISFSKIKPRWRERDFFAIAIGGQGLPALPVHFGRARHSARADF